MAIYSKKIIQFIEKIKVYTQTILRKELGLETRGERFILNHLNLSFPIKIVIFNDEKRVGYFDGSCYELGFHELLMRSSEEKLKDLIRHELAHYILFIQYKGQVMPHGIEFRNFCRAKGWGESVYLATTCLDDGIEERAKEEHLILRKVEKLMALSKSSNHNEAELALIKSRELLLKYNLENIHGLRDDEEQIVMKRVLRQKKQDAKMHTVSTILQTFFVSTVFARKRDFTCLEIVGTRLNVEIAEYVAAFLENELDRLWLISRKEHPELKGVVAKNSFFYGIGRGYVDKIEQLKNQPLMKSLATSKELISLENQLKESLFLVYPHLRTFKRGGNYNPEATALGQSVGNKLTIHKGLGQKTESRGSLIGFRDQKTNKINKIK